MSAASARSLTVDQLRRQLMKSQLLQVERAVVSTGFPELDALMPENGLPTGSVIEWVSDAPGLRATSLALKCAARFLHQPGTMAVVDPVNDFHPASVEHLGIPLSRLLVVRPNPECAGHTFGTTMLSHSDRSNALWALEQLTRCAGVNVVVTWIDRLSSTAQRRLQLAVENSGVTVFLMRPPQALQQSSWADLRFRIRSTTAATATVQSHECNLTPTSAAQFSVQLVRSKNAVQHQGSAVLECHNETGDVSPPPQLARQSLQRSLRRRRV